MEQIAQVCELLKKKRELFFQYEQATDTIVAGDAEKIMECMELRAQLQEQIDETEQNIQAVCAGCLWKDQLVAAAGNRCSRGELPEELRPVFDCGMAVYSVMSRIREMEPQALARITEERDGFLEKIKSVNQGNEAAASKYYRSTSPRATEERQRTVKKV